MLAALLVGAQVLVPPAPADFLSLCEFAERFSPTVLHCTPSFLLRIPPSARVRLLRCVQRQVATGGEPPVSWDVLCAGALPVPQRYLSFYGVTELSVWSSVLHITPQSLRHLGRPIKVLRFVCYHHLHAHMITQGTQLWLDDAGRLCTSRGGISVVTSDLGRALPDGTLEYVGRADRVHKRFGKALSLDCLETHVVLLALLLVRRRAHFTAHREVARTAAVVERCRVELVDIEVVAFVVARPNVQRKLVKNSVRRALPPHSTVLILEALPVNEHGKVE